MSVGSVMGTWAKNRSWLTARYFVSPYCWWFRNAKANRLTTPVNNGIQQPYELVNAGFLNHQPYQWPQNTGVSLAEQKFTSTNSSVILDHNSLTLAPLRNHGIRHRARCWVLSNYTLRILTPPIGNTRPRKGALKQVATWHQKWHPMEP